MPGDVIQKLIQGLARSVVDDLTDPANPVSLVLPAASAITYDTGIELGEAESVSCQGVKITRARFKRQEKPKVTLTLANTPEAIALKLNRKFATQTSVSSFLFQSEFIVPPDGIVAAKPTGTLGQAVTADAVSKAWQINTAGVTDPVALTQGTYASFDAATTTSGFAVGAAAAMKFGSALWNSTVSFRIPVTIASLSALGSTPYSALALKMAFVTIDGKSVMNIRFDSVSIDSSGSINFNDGQTEVPLFANSQPIVELIPLANFC